MRQAVYHDAAVADLMEVQMPLFVVLASLVDDREWELG